MRKYLPFFRFLWLLIIVSVSSAHAEYDRSRTSFSSDSEARDLPGGIVYPSLHGSIFENPAGLATGEDATSVELLYGPPTLGTSQSAYEGSIVVTSLSGWGVGFGYSALSNSAGYNYFTPRGFTVADSLDNSSNYAFAGASYRLNDLRAGLSFALPIAGSSAASSALNLGLQFKMTSESFVALVLDSLNNSPYATLGLGIFEEGRYNIELDLTTPPFSNSGSSYYLTLNSDLYAGAFGTGFFATYQTTNSGSNALNLSYGLALMLKPWRKFDVQARFLANNTTILGLDFTL